MPAELNNDTVLTHQTAAAAVHSSDIAAMQPLSYSDPLAILGAAPYPDAPWWKRISPSTLFVLLAGAIAVWFLAHELAIAGKLGFPVDEAWIDQVYARNFFHHVAFEFNAGERMAGPTAPFWVVFVAIGRGLFHDPILTSKLLGAIFLFLTGYYGFRLLRTIGNDYGSSLLGGILIVTTSQLAWSELSGLESTLSTALVVGALWWHFANPYGWRRTITGAIFALAALTRPETGLIFALVIVHSYFHYRYERNRGVAHEHSFREITLSVLVFILILAPIALTNVALSGAIVPETFYAGLSNHSALILIRHGKIAELLSQLLSSFQGIWFVIRDVYVPENPLWIVTIVIALVTQRRNPLVERDRSDILFYLSLLILVVFPYLRALVIGVNDSFGEFGRWMHFLLPVYALAGFLSIRIIARYALFRTLNPKQMVLGISAAIILTGFLYFLVRPESAPSFETIPPAIDYVLLFFFVGVLMYAGLRYAELPLWKKMLPHSVTEAERNNMDFRFHENEDGRLSLPTMKTLHASLIVLLAWNLTELPRTANDFAESVRAMNTEHVALARVIANVTLPTEAIATNSIGTIGWFTERRVIDISGHLTKEPIYNARMLGPDRGLLQTLIDTRPQYLAIFGRDYSTTIANGLETGFFERVYPATQRLPVDMTFLRINYQRIVEMGAGEPTGNDHTFLSK